MTKNNYHLYFGKAGQLVVMSEFLLRGWNVAIPEVDEGDDIFVVRHETSKLMRIQVKASNLKVQRNSKVAQFNISLKQLFDTPKNFHYIFVSRDENSWKSLLIINQLDLLDLYKNQSLGSAHKDNLTLRLIFKNEKVTNKKIDLTEYQNNFEDFIIEI
jgi:hypothetical protein